MSEVPTEEEIKEIIEIAMFKRGAKNDAILLDPKMIKQNIINNAESFGVEVLEMAKYEKTAIKSLYEKTMVEIDSLIEIYAAREHISG